jgi:coenzyme F420-dependent glucose-6-phosphate dehydrogenase
MIQIGYALSREEHSPLGLVHFPRCAEEIDFDFSMISDHIHPWVPSQGNSPLLNEELNIGQYSGEIQTVAWMG